MNSFEQVVSELRKSAEFFSATRPVYVSRAPGRAGIVSQ